MAIGIIALLGARLWWASLSTLDPDEGFSLRIVRHSWSQLFTAVLSDIVHPPAFYLTLKLWLACVGEHLFLLRLLPVLFSAVSVIPILLLFRALRLPPSASCLGILFVAVNPFLVGQGQELRMYSLFLLLGMASLWLLTECLSPAPAGRVYWIGLTVVNLLMVYTHYFAWVWIGLEIVFALWHARSRLAALCVSTAAVVLCFVPWAVALASHAGTTAGLAAGVEEHLGWLSRPGWRDLVTYFAGLNGYFRSGLGFSKLKTAVGFLIFWTPVALVFARSVRRGAPEAHWRSADGVALDWLAFFALAPVILVFFLSQITSISVFEGRYLICASIPYLALCAVGFTSLRPRPLRAGAVALAVVWAAAGFREGARLQDRIDWSALVDGMRAAEARSASFRVPLYVLGHVEPIRYTLQRQGEERFDVRSGISPKEIDVARFWLAYQESYWNPKWAPELRRELQARGYVLVSDLQSGLEQHREHLTLWVKGSAP